MYGLRKMGFPNIIFLMILFIMGPVPLILLVLNWRKSRRQKPSPTRSEFWAKGETNRTWSDERLKE
jgi:hypothetical protein